MRRFASIFIIVNLLLCYSGFYHGAFALLKPSSHEVSSGCHSMNHSYNKTESGDVNHIINQSTGRTSYCCYDGLLGASVDLSANIDHVLVHTITVDNLNSNSSYSKITQHRSLREHDPPDLQISNSVFLL